MNFDIEVKGLRKSFQKHEAVKGLTMHVSKGEIFALLGPNGAGKTTTIRMLTTLLRPDEGSATICGLDIVRSAPEVRRLISVTGQFAALDERLTGMQNLVMFARLRGYTHKEACLVSAKLLERFGLTGAATRTVDTYSGGMSRRLDIAASLIARPQVIFLDEPSTGLDPQSRIELWEMIRSIADQGTTIVLTTQYLEEAEQLADRIGIMKDGCMVAVGTPDQLKATIGMKHLRVHFRELVELEQAIPLLENSFGITVLHGRDRGEMTIPIHHVRLAHQVMQSLLAREYSIDAYTLANPSLDEAFLALTAASPEEGVS